MRLFFRRHRGSQSVRGPRVSISMSPDADPAQIARELSFVMAGRPRPERLTARQVLIDSLRKDDYFVQEPDHRIGWLANQLLLDLDEAGLEIVAEEDVE
ncbi:hypothetical protein [Streptosporangium sp. NPDC051022]|uniref:hypothetical protein n=1 Tax=Streptosporangium sp. NPDC051022 TaxID=3155752 RepID=UPI003435EB62